MLERRLEEAALNAWPALRQMLCDGWVVRFSRGYTKRANSVNPLYTSSLELREKVATCERLYREQGLPPIFRLTPFTTSSMLDGVLDERGYATIEPSLVLHRDLQDRSEGSAGELREEALDDWLALFCEWSGVAGQRRPTLRAILEAIPTRRWLVTLPAEERTVACALGVLEGEFFGIFDLVTAPQHRGRGHAARLMQSLLNRAQAHGAAQAYLQVVQSNAPARRLYEKLGFSEAYPYWYRVLPSTHSTGD
ncbi:MAG TPA: GNAT family N-acetyltransferase [Longimicrobiaceae bacterium]|nr:GNAT family N-acetyltransferase [Longimicrobiaceae bacterium]